jgi:hypothetical protein
VCILIITRYVHVTLENFLTGRPPMYPTMGPGPSMPPRPTHTVPAAAVDVRSSSTIVVLRTGNDHNSISNPIHI